MKLTFAQARYISILTIVAFLPAVLPAQSESIPINYDSAYIRTFPYQITARVFGSQKYTNLRIEEPDNGRKLYYRPNTPTAIGVGASYRALTVNIAVGSIKDDARGKSKTLDLLSHIYSRKWIADIYGQFYKGYYIGDKGYAAPNANSFYIRPDIKLSEVGLAAYRVTNDKRFSYRATFLQNEWQQKSAGTFLFGGEFFHGVVRGDSALLPAALNSQYTQDGIKKIRYLEGGPGVGYAYTLVVAKHFFVMATGIGNADINYTKEFTNNSSSDKVSFSPNFSWRGGVGYNSNTWGLAATWFSNRVMVNGTEGRDNYFVNAGNLRFTLVKRFTPGPRLKRLLRIVEWLPYK